MFISLKTIKYGRVPPSDQPEFTDQSRVDISVCYNTPFCEHIKLTRWSLSLGTNVEVGIVEVVADIPSQHLELLPLQQNCMEPTQGEEQAPILLNLLHAIVGLLRQRWNCSVSFDLLFTVEVSFDAATNTHSDWSALLQDSGLWVQARLAWLNTLTSQLGKLRLDATLRYLDS